MARTSLQLNIISAEKTLFSGEVLSAVFPGASGKFGVYPEHAPLISPLQAGVITYVIAGKEHTIEVSGGIVEINSGVITVCLS